MRPDTELTGAKILIVDDQPENVALLETMLATRGYLDLVSTTDPRRALPLFLEHRPDLVLLDLHMPHLDGFGVLDQLASRSGPDEHVPILVLTAEVSPSAKRRALAAGANDFVSKPFDVMEVQLRIDSLLHTRLLHLALRRQNDTLEARVRARTLELAQAQRDVAERLARAADYRDDDTGRHIYRVGENAALVAREIGWSTADVDLIRQAAPLHDVGKIGIPDRILLKPGKLTPQEFERMKDHTTIGARLLGGSSSPLLEMAREIALMHHERWDGSGYAGLSGTAIPIAARITAVVDVFDALTNPRPYKEAWPIEKAVEEIVRQSGRHFDPALVEAFLRVLEQRRPIQPDDLVDADV